MEEWQFAFGVDANYVKYAGVMMTSIVLNHPGQPVCFHLACSGIDEADKVKLDEFTRLYCNTRIMIYDVRELLKSVPELVAAPERLNKTVFLRILLPNFLAKELTKVIYLDADMLCIGRLDKLWQVELNNKAVAASFYPKPCEHASRLNLKGEAYFNAGMMLMNLPIWRQQKLTRQVLELYKKHGKDFVLLEQDALNCILEGQVIELSPCFNHMVDAFNPLQAKILPEDAIIHFVNEGKPWIRYCADEIEQLYWSYVRRSLWFTMEPGEPWDVKTAFLAGKNAEGRGEYKEAAYYLGIAAHQLMKFYLEKTNQLTGGENIEKTK